MVVEVAVLRFCKLFLLDDGDDLVEIFHTQPGVDLRVFLVEQAFVSFDIASDSDDFFLFCLFFKGNCILQAVTGFFFCRFDESAGVEDENIRFLRISDKGVSRLFHVAEHDFTVHEVFRTAIADKSDLLHTSSIVKGCLFLVNQDDWGQALITLINC
ncbi:hypothetical protein ES703_115361 [subsurface metagenome]